MKEVTIIGLDIAKNIFQAHGAYQDGGVAFRKKLSRGKVLSFLSAQPPCIVALEACASAHYWGREIGRIGHEVRLIPPIYVKPFVKRQKNDQADAEAITEAASRPTMRFVAVKSEAKQALGMAFKTRDLFVRQRTQLINALRGHLAEYGVISPKGIVYLRRLQNVVEAPDNGLPGAVIALAGDFIKQIAELTDRIGTLGKEIRCRTSEDTQAARLMTIPGIGPISAAALEAFAPPAQSFRRGRDFAAWLGLAPRQYSTGGKERLGKISKMGQRDLRRLLITGAMSVVRQSARKGAPEGTWLASMLARKPRMLVAVALANKTARIVWALMASGEVYRNPVSAA